MRYKQQIIIGNEIINAEDYPDDERKRLLIEESGKLNDFICKNDKNSHIFPHEENKTRSLLKTLMLVFKVKS